MDAIREFVTAMFSDPVTDWIIGLLFLFAFADFLTGSLRAIADGQFTWSAWDVFVRVALAGRVIPLTLLLLIARIVAVGAPADMKIPGLDLSILTTAGVAAAVPYLAATLSSIVANVNPQAAHLVPNDSGQSGYLLTAKPIIGTTSVTK